jgi:hypothetical protein
MGILGRFQTKNATSLNGSEYGPKYIATGKLPTSPLAGNGSTLHADPSGKEGYSLNGAGQSDVQKLYNTYDDGTVNNLPPASTLDNPAPYDINKKPYTEKTPYSNPEISAGGNVPVSGVGNGAIGS